MLQPAVTVSPDSSNPYGLHVHLISAGATLEVGLWFEHYLDKSAYRLPFSSTPGVRHPGCVTTRPWFLPEGSRQVSFFVSAPRMGKGFPIALPGLLDGWDLTGFKPGNRTIAEGLYEVVGWTVPIELSLLPLKSFLLDW